MQKVILTTTFPAEIWFRIMVFNATFNDIW